MRVNYLYILIAVLVGVLVVVMRSMNADAQIGSNVSVPQVNTLTSTPVSRNSSWLSVVPDKTTLTAGDTLNLQFTITNAITTSVDITGTTYLPSPGDTGFTYNQNECWALTNNGTTKFPKVKGAIRVMAGYVGWDTVNANKAQKCPVGSTFDHPWRWSIESTTLTSGASRVINGAIVMNTPGTYTFVFGIVKDFVGYPYANCNPNGDPEINVCGLQTTTITVLAPDTPTPTNSRTLTSTRTHTNTRTATVTRTRTEVVSNSRIVRYLFNEAPGTYPILQSAISAQTRLACGGTVLAPDVRCPTIVASGIDGNAAHFAGSQTAQVSGPLILNGKGTISFWAKPNLSGTEMNVISLASASSAISVGFDSSGKFFCSFGSNRLTASSSTFSASDWNHFVCTFDSQSKQRVLYINSEPVINETITSAPSSNFSKSVVGSNANQNSNYYDGDLDEVSIYNTYLNISQVEELYRFFVLNDPTRISPTRTNTATITRSRTPTITNTPFPLDFKNGNFVARYTFNESTGATSFANFVTTSNPAICPTTCPTAGSSGMRFSNAISFTGIESLKLTKTILAPSSFGISMWMYPTSLANEMVALAAKNSQLNNVLTVGTTANGEAFCRFGSDMVISNTTLSQNDWTHVLCFIATNKNITLYINGAPDATSTFTAVPSGLLSVWFGIDGFSATSPYIGKIDEVALYNTALTWNDVEVIYDQYTFANRRSPTRSRTPSPTRTFTKTRTPTFTPSLTFTYTPVPAGAYPYPLPLGTATKTPTISLTPTRTRSITLTRSITPSRSLTPSKTFTPSKTYTPSNTPTLPAVPYPYPTP